MQRYWFGDVKGTECVSCTIRSSDGTVEAARIAALVAATGSALGRYRPIQWKVAQACGCVRDRSDYICRLRSACFFAAKSRIAMYSRRPDVELIHLVKIVDAIDTANNLLLERAVELYRVTHPTFSRKKRPIHEKKLIGLMSQDARGPIGILIEEIESLTDARMHAADFVATQASHVLPNTSALVGGLVAARLLVEAGDLYALVRLPSATIQVLGARKALFAHLKGDAPSPKHGIIYQHRRIHTAPASLRGRVARTIAAQLAVAIRIDYHRGTLDPQFLHKAEGRIARAGEHR